MRFAVVGLLLLMVFGTGAAVAGPDGRGPAARLSEALGGTLDGDLGEAGALEHPIDYSAITINPGRAIEYRRRVELERRLATQTALASRSPLPVLSVGR